MKRHISIVLIISMILSSVNLAFASDFEAIGESIFCEYGNDFPILGERSEENILVEYPVPEDYIDGKLRDISAEAAFGFFGRTRRCGNDRRNRKK